MLHKKQNPKQQKLEKNHCFFMHLHRLNDFLREIIRRKTIL